MNPRKLKKLLSDPDFKKWMEAHAQEEDVSSFIESFILGFVHKHMRAAGDAMRKAVPILERYEKEKKP